MNHASGTVSSRACPACRSEANQALTKVMRFEHVDKQLASSTKHLLHNKQCAGFWNGLLMAVISNPFYNPAHCLLCSRCWVEDANCSKLL